MGWLISLRCDTCGYEQAFQLGGGMQDWDTAVIRNALTQEDAKQFDEIAKVGMQAVTIDRQLGLCKMCKKFITLPLVRCRMADSTEKKIKNHCPACASSHVEPILLDRANEKVHCPHCKQAVTITQTGCWD